MKRQQLLARSRHSLSRSLSEPLLCPYPQHSVYHKHSMNPKSDVLIRPHEPQHWKSTTSRVMHDFGDPMSLGAAPPNGPASGTLKAVPRVRIPFAPPHSLKCREICLDCSGNCRKLAHFRNSCSQSGPEKVSCSLLPASFAAFFSGGHTSSPVSTTRSGECIGIATPRTSIFGENSASTCASALFLSTPSRGFRSFKNQVVGKCR